MSRSGYSDEIDDHWSLIRWRGAVASAIKGRRGQDFLRELLSALDAMPEKRLTTNELEADGEFCTLGVLGNARGVDMASLDPEDFDQVSQAFGVAPALVREIVYLNDEFLDTYDTYKWLNVEGPPIPGCGRPQAHVAITNHKERRWKHMRTWVSRQIRCEA